MDQGRPNASRISAKEEIKPNNFVQLTITAGFFLLNSAENFNNNFLINFVVNRR